MAHTLYGPGPDGNAGDNWNTAVNADEPGGDQIRTGK